MRPQTQVGARHGYKLEWAWMPRPTQMPVEDVCI